MFNFSQQFEAIKASVVGVSLIIACTVLGFIWISIGLYAFAVKLLGTTWGPIALGVLFLLPILVVAVRSVVAPKDRRSNAQKAYDAAFANSSVGSIAKMIETMSAHSPLLAAVVAVAGGFLASRFPQFLAIFAELVTAFGDELSRNKKRKAEDAVRKAAAYEASGTQPPPPDFAPVSKRRRKSKGDEDIYEG